MKSLFTFNLLNFFFLLCLGLSLPLAVEGQITRLPYADTTSGNYFGTSVALDGALALVGASGERSCADGGGAAYLYEFIDSTGYWQETARLVPSDCEPGLAFGRKVALNGGVALVAASQEYFAAKRPNAVYVFEENDLGEWVQTARLIHSGLQGSEGAAGAAIAIQDGRILFTTGGDPSPDNQTDGAAYIFEKSSNRWEQKHRLTRARSSEGGVFGGSASLGRGSMAVVSSSYFSKKTGAVYLFELTDNDSWDEVARLGGIEGFFVSLDLHGDEMIVGQAEAGARESGLATLFKRDSTGIWYETATLEPPTPYRKGAFGTEVALYEDRALVVGYDEQLSLNFNVDRVVFMSLPAKMISGPIKGSSILEMRPSLVRLIYTAILH